MTTVNDLKWYTTFFFLIGAISSFADPVTDALTLAEYYRENHMQWFQAGVSVMPISCGLIFLAYLMIDGCRSVHSVTDCVVTMLVMFSPFFAAWASFKGFLLCLKNFKKLWHGEQVDRGNHDEDEINRFLQFVKLAPLLEAIMESIPQFIIQFYVANVQEEPVKAIQMTSLLVSCFSLVWAFTAGDELLHNGEIEVKIKEYVLFFVENDLLLTSRLLAIFYFGLEFRRWVTIVLVSHSLISALADRISPCVGYFGDRKYFMWFWILFWMRWIRDDLCVPIDRLDIGSRRQRLRRVQWLSHLMSVIENFAMILLFFYLSKYSNTWYAFPVTVYVCTASILGSFIRLVHFRFLLKCRVAPRMPDVFVPNPSFMSDAD